MRKKQDKNEERREEGVRVGRPNARPTSVGIGPWVIDWNGLERGRERVNGEGLLRRGACTVGCVVVRTMHGREAAVLHLLGESQQGAICLRDTKTKHTIQLRTFFLCSCIRTCKRTRRRTKVVVGGKGQNQGASAQFCCQDSL